jgi:hypothetical protein
MPKKIINVDNFDCTKNKYNTIYGSSYSGMVESSKMNPYQAESLLKEMNISDIERYIRKEKLEKINNDYRF